MEQKQRGKFFDAKRKSRILPSVLTGLALALIVFIAAPIDIFANNLEEFAFSFSDFGILSVLFAVLLTAIVTAYCGPVIFLGLAVPHLCRAIFQTSDHRVLMPAVLFAGAALALVCNLIARMPGFEGALPVNSVTALIGAPVVASVLFRKRKNELNE